MAKLAIIGLPVADAPTKKTDAEGNETWSFDPPARQAAWDVHVVRYRKIGIPHTVGAIPYDVYNCQMRDSFITDSEATAENPATPLPPNWVVAHAVKINKQVVTRTPLPDIVIPASDITDDVFTRTKTYHRRNVQPQYDNTDPDNTVFLGVHLRTRTGVRLVESVDDTDPDNPITNYLFTDGVLNGSYTRTWTETAKRIKEVAETTEPGFLVQPESLEQDGTYLYQRTEETLVTPSYTLLEPAHPELLEWSRDQLDDDGNTIRGLLFDQEFTFGRAAVGRMNAGARAFSNGFSRGFG